jgi:hypothetical protein
MPRQRSSRGKASKAATARPGRDAPSLARFETLARDGLNALAKDADAFRKYLAPIAALEERHRLVYEPDERLDEYARDHGKSYLAVSRAVGAAVRDGTLDVSGAYFGGWRDEYADWFVSPQLRVYVADQPGSTADPALRYKLEWTDQQPELNFWDPSAHATRWRDQLAIASKVDGTCLVRSSTNGDQTDVQAGVGVLFQPVRRRAMFQFRALALWTSWVSISADAPAGPAAASECDRTQLRGRAAGGPELARVRRRRLSHRRDPRHAAMGLLRSDARSNMGARRVGRCEPRRRRMDRPACRSQSRVRALGDHAVLQQLHLRAAFAQLGDRFGEVHGPLHLRRALAGAGHGSFEGRPRERRADRTRKDARGRAHWRLYRQLSRERRHG